MALSAAPFDRSWTLPLPPHQWVFSIRTNGRKRPIPNIPKRVLPPKGVRIRFTQVIDISNIHPPEALPQSIEGKKLYKKT
jgi:hypothetical protein